MTTERQAWFLEQSLDSGGTRHVDLEPFPFRIGRAPEVNLKLDDPSVSRVHAELVTSNHQLKVRDLGSRNGTFVNRQPVASEALVRMGDVLHLGSVEFRLRWTEATSARTAPTELFEGELPSRLPTGTRELSDLLSEGAVSVCVQPIVEAEAGAEHGLELLGRGVHPDLPVEPLALFRIAESVGRAAALSELFRQRGLEALSSLNPESRIFINTHPEELRDLDRLFAGLREMRALRPDTPLVLEVHELAVVDQEAMLAIRDALTDLDIGLAYDDFGAGESRFLELVTVPPDYLKFDDALVSGLDQASSRRLALIEMLLKLARDFGIASVAEGVSTEGEATACRLLGFDYLQGFHLGNPRQVAIDP